MNTTNKHIVLFCKDFYDYKVLNDYEIDVEFVEKFRKLTSSKILFGGALPFSRVQPPKWFKNVFDLSIPDWKTYSDISFEEATDARSQQMIDLYSKKDIPIAVNWSGGIDSTLILSAIHKNFPDYLKKRVVVVMNNSSYTENPFFYNNIISKNYKVGVVGQHNYLNNFILHGDPADSYWIQGNVLQLSTHSDVVNDDVNSNPENFVNFYKSKGIDDNDIEWYVDFYKKTASDVGIDIKSTSDFLWWSNFSCHPNFSTMKYVNKIPFEMMKPETNFINLYRQNAEPWYLNDLYQVWSIQSQFNGVKFDGSIRSYKMEAKKYIYEVDKNEYYRDYKTKQQSLIINTNGMKAYFKTVIDSEGNVY